MRRLVQNFKHNWEIRSLASETVRHLRPKDQGAELRAIRDYVRDHIRYLRDVRGIETIADPLKTLEMGQGDCDDQAILVASLLESIGFPTRFVAIGFSAGRYEHVYAEARVGARWVSVETTEPFKVGQQPRGLRSRMVVHV